MAELREVDVVILGAGTAGLNALRQVKDAGKTFVLIERGDLGTMCARTGCIPSKAVLHASAQMGLGVNETGSSRLASVKDNANELWKQARKTRQESVAGEAKETLKLAGDDLIRGDARIVGPNDIRVGEQMIRARAVVIATGSAPIVPDEWKALGDGILTTDSLFDLKQLPTTIGVIGLGAIGLEMGVALSRLGVRVVGADQTDTIGGIADPFIETAARQHFEREMLMWLGAAVDVSRNPSGSFQLRSKHRERSAEVDCVLVALGRRSTLSTLGLESAGIVVDDHGKVEFDPQTMRIGTSNFYLAGDVSVSRPLQHEAADEGAIAGWNAARHGSCRSWRRRVPLSIGFTNPDFASIGCSFDKLPRDTVIVEATSDGNARSKIKGADDNVVRLYISPNDRCLIGAAVFARGAEHLAHLLAWAVTRNETVEGMLRMPFYHPTVEEIIQNALREAAKKLSGHEGIDLAPVRDE